MAALRVFISHASADSAFAERLAADLRNAGADVWLDSTHLTGPGDFVARISHALNERDVLVLVLSPAAIASQWVPDEMNAAIVRAKQGYMRPPLVVQYGNVPTRDIPGLWTTYQRIDATSDYYAALNRALVALGLRQSAPLPPLPSPATVVVTPMPKAVPPGGAPLPVSPKTIPQKQAIMNSWLRIGLVFGLALAALQFVIDQTASVTNLPIYLGPFFLTDIIEFPIIFVIALAGGYRSLKQSGRMSHSLLSGVLIGLIGMALDIAVNNIADAIRFQQPLFGFVTSVYLLIWLRYAVLAAIVGLAAGALGGVVGLRRAKR